MTREEAKQNTWRAHCNFDDPRKAIHIVIDQIFDEHLEELKAERKKSRSIVAMLYWDAKKKSREFEDNMKEDITLFELMFNAWGTFDRAYKILKVQND
jgi:hypothetical protein